MADDGTPLPNGERGEIVLRSSLVMRGYYKNPEATAEASAHGWHHTGDIGYISDEGFLYIVDRAKDMVITGGFNVYSSEVEQAVMTHDAVADCAVVGLPDEEWGQRVVMAVICSPDAHPPDVSLDALRSWGKERLAPAKVPVEVVALLELPRNAMGKVTKPTLATVLITR